MYDIKNKYTILFIFDPGCGHCREETPKLVEFYNKSHTKFDFQVFAVASDTSMVKMKNFIKEFKTPWITVNGPRSYLPEHYSTLYYEIIRQKTASLIASCCAVGASSAGATPEVVENMKKFGECVGMAFQIKDDLFDYGDDEIGKPLGIDIKEKKMTLPLIHSLSKAPWLEKRRIIGIVKNNSEDARKVKLVIDFVKKSGGIEYANQKMKVYFDQAMTLLETVPPSEYKTSLVDLVKFTIERKN